MLFERADKEKRQTRLQGIHLDSHRRYQVEPSRKKLYRRGDQDQDLRLLTLGSLKHEHLQRGALLYRVKKLLKT